MHELTPHPVSHTLVYHYQLERWASGPNPGSLFVMEFPRAPSNGKYAYIDTYSDLPRFGRDKEEVGLSGKSIYSYPKTVRNLFLCAT